MARSVLVLVCGPRVSNMCVCASINPGSTVSPPRSNTCAPAGIFTCPSGPTSTIRSPVMTITCFASIAPVLLSNKRPARTAIVCGAAGHLYIPPSAPTHGVGPAPRHAAAVRGVCPRARAPARPRRVQQRRQPPPSHPPLPPQRPSCPPHPQPSISASSRPYPSHRFFASLPRAESSPRQKLLSTNWTPRDTQYLTNSPPCGTPEPGTRYTGSQ